MFKDICAGVGLVVLVILVTMLSIWLIREIVNWLIDKLFKCKHKWEFYDCGYTPDSFYIELRCKKCREIKHIECDIDVTKWDIEYIEQRRDFK